MLLFEFKYQLENNKTRVEMLKKNSKLTNQIMKCGFSMDFENCSYIRNLFQLEWKIDFRRSGVCFVVFCLRKSSPRSTQYKWKGVVSRTVNRVVSKTVKAFLIYNFFDCASVKTAAVKIESYLSFKELAFKTRSLKDSKLKLNWWQLIWRNSLIRFYTVFYIAQY